ncbi:MAG TPA: outer membrane beta-barrel protein [Steroidobacteraceae bacterium]
MPRRGSPVAMPALFALLAAASTSHAALPGYEISVGAIESDNIERVPQGGKHDTVLEQQLRLTWHDERPRLDADIDADLSHLTYVPRIFADQVIGNLIGSAKVGLVPQVLFWDISDNFGQGVTDPLAAVTPQNRENINYFTTGPELLMQVGGDNFLHVRGTYGKTSYQRSQLDANRFGAGLGFIHRLSSVVDVSLNLNGERNNYAYDNLFPDFSTQEAFVHVDAKGSRTTLGADLGYGRIETSSSDVNGVVTPSSSHGSVTARLQATRKLSASSTLSMSAGREYSDAAAAFQVAQVLSGANLGTQQTVQTNGPFTMVYETVGWNWARGRSTLGITASHFKDTYVETAGLDDTRAEIDLNASRRLSPTVQVSLLEQYLRQVFTNVAGNSTVSTTDARLAWQPSRRITVSFDYMFSRRSSEVRSTDYRENTVWLSIGYGRPAEIPPGVPAPPMAHPTTY